LLHSGPSRHLLRYLLSLLLLRIFLRAREQHHGQIGLSLTILIVNQDLLRHRREG
jgi:hypothetical protein